MTDYMTNPGKVDDASGPRPERDESVPNPFALRDKSGNIVRNPVRPQRGRPADAPICPGNGDAE